MGWRLAKALVRLRGQVNEGKSADFDKLVPRIVADDASGCWQWTGGIRSNGYGTFAVKRGGRWTQTTAHRAIFECVVSGVPDGYEVDHLCRNRACVNPSHLEAVTLQENRTRRNLAKTHCVNGHLYTQDNTRIQIGSDGYACRVCRTCERERHRIRRAA